MDRHPSRQALSCDGALRRVTSQHPADLGRSCATLDGDAVGEVCWSDGHLITARPIGATVTLPPGFDAVDSSFILAEVARPYRPTIGHAISGTINLSGRYALAGAQRGRGVPRSGVTCL